MPHVHPVLYSFRRCPYAMRARMAIRICDITYEHREILLKEKPKSMLAYSPKGTVPVLITETKQVVDESLDVMLWAIDKVNHPLKESLDDSKPWIKRNDTFFKPNLDRYKYPSRYAHEGSENEVHSKAHAQAEIFLQELDEVIGQNGGFILSNKMSLADIAIFPFIRQFSKVDEKKWHQTPLKNLTQHLNLMLQLNDFNSIMIKYDLWVEGQEPLIITGQET